MKDLKKTLKIETKESPPYEFKIAKNVLKTLTEIGLIKESEANTYYNNFKGNFNTTTTKLTFEENLNPCDQDKETNMNSFLGELLEKLKKFEGRTSYKDAHTRAITNEDKNEVVNNFITLVRNLIKNYLVQGNFDTTKIEKTTVQDKKNSTEIATQIVNGITSSFVGNFKDGRI
jgi:hypothetical protein